MSLYDYKMSLELGRGDPPFYALIMAAMRKADSDNIERLKMVFPDVYAELFARYNAAGGCLTDEEREARFPEPAQKKECKHCGKAYCPKTGDGARFAGCANYAAEGGD